MGELHRAIGLDHRQDLVDVPHVVGEKAGARNTQRALRTWYAWAWRRL